ncbi:MAG TPA: hypothetical protein PLF01_02575 [Alphaproteobacteria bacterium]|nr:hypothetical protein [Alphaproteobacteria bacterium]
MNDVSLNGTENAAKVSDFCVESFRAVCDQIWQSTNFRKHFDLPETPCAVHAQSGLVVARKSATPYDAHEYVTLGQLGEDGKVTWLAKGKTTSKKPMEAEVIAGQCHVAVGTKIAAFKLG